MPELSLFSYPLSTLMLYFVFYSVVGWAMETVYCSILEKRFVPRGFLHGPLCPIYGVGVLLMILFFKPLAGNLLVFYLVSTVSMSAWEYFVGWFLEVTTHVKYWDYSMYPFNLKGRICLWVCLVWGVLSYAAVFWLHPPVERLIAAIPTLARQIAALVLFALVAADAVLTIRELALMTKALNKLRQVGKELRFQTALDRAGLEDKLAAARDTVSEKLAGARETVSAALPDSVGAAADKLKARYNELLNAAEKRTRRYRRVYANLSAPKMERGLREAIRERGRQVAQERRARRARKRAGRRAKGAAKGK